jgi:hypothetical protein
MVFDVFVEQWWSGTGQRGSKLDVAPHRSFFGMESMLSFVKGRTILWWYRKTIALCVKTKETRTDTT